MTFFGAPIFYKVLSRMFGYFCVNSSVFVVHMLSVFLRFCYFSRFRKVQLTFWISSSWLFCAVNMLFRLMGTIIQYEYECKTFIQWIWVESRKDVVPETSSTSVAPVFLSWNLCAPIAWTYSELLFNEMLRHSTKLNVYCFQKWGNHKFMGFFKCFLPKFAIDVLI